MIFINYILKNWKRIGLKILPYFLIIAFTFFIMRFSIINQSFIGGTDTNFHMNSFYEAAKQIATGHYSYFMSLYGFNQNGRIVNAVYGPVFDYFGGLLLLATHSWARFQITLFIITIAISGIGMNLLARKARVNYWVAIIISYIYMLSHPIITSWLGNSEFTGLGATILPFIIMAGIDIIQCDQIRILHLALPVAIILQIHLMTSIVAILSLVPFILIELILTHHRIRLLINGSLATLVGLLLSGNIWGAIYDIYSSNHVIPTAPAFEMQSFTNSLNYHNLDTFFPAGTFILIMIIIYAIIQRHKMCKLDWALLIDSFIFLLLSSSYFPWNHLWHIWPDISSIVQFPIRFLPVVSILLILLLGRIVTKIGHLQIEFRLPVIVWGSLSIIILTVLAINIKYDNNYVKWASSTVWNRPYVVRYNEISNYSHNGTKLRNAYQSYNLYKGLNIINKITTDYMPTSKAMTQNEYYDAPTNHNFAKDFINNPIHFKREASNHQLNLTWRLSKQKMNKIELLHRKAIIPVTDYGKSIVTLNKHRIHPKKTIVGAIKLKVRPNYTYHLTVHYRPGLIFRMASFLTIINWLIILVIGCLKIVKKKEWPILFSVKR